MFVEKWYQFRDLLDNSGDKPYFQPDFSEQNNRSSPKFQTNEPYYLIKNIKESGNKVDCRKASLLLRLFC
ncbi:MAG: hypothetical protein LBU34_10110 [Planctomycetaceae bacterium]|nr:hypothetical protein [Planctomycetaceae bacterium]